ncbi:MAG: DUF4290 domain-containing protein [Flavobacteriia bacterium]|nr:DUF4290 domain-containing protein [Cryomorphaceae bacterium]
MVHCPLKEKLSMEYNTTRGKLILPEYGRNVQNMIAHAMEIADRTERNRAAQAIIEVMGQLNPHLRDVDDFRHKLWTHLFVMSDFSLDVDSPYEIPKQEVLNEKPAIMDYPKGNIRYGHYGKYTQRILEKSDELTDEKETEYLKNTMANFMKKQFLAYNNDAVENHVIAQQLKELSKGRLILENPDELTNTNTILRAMGLNQKQRPKGNFKKNNNNNKKKFIKK